MSSETTRPSAKIHTFQLGSPNEHLQARMKRLQEHPDFPLFIEHLSLIGANPSTLAEIVKRGLVEKADEEAIVYESNENPTNFARYQAAKISEEVFSGAKGYSVEPSPPPHQHLKSPFLQHVPQVHRLREM